MSHSASPPASGQWRSRSTVPVRTRPGSSSSLPQERWPAPAARRPAAVDLGPRGRVPMPSNLTPRHQGGPSPSPLLGLLLVTAVLLVAGSGCQGRGTYSLGWTLDGQMLRCGGPPGNDATFQCSRAGIDAVQVEI